MRYVGARRRYVDGGVLEDLNCVLDGCSGGQQCGVRTMTGKTATLGQAAKDVRDCDSHDSGSDASGGRAARPWGCGADVGDA
jgi:hypothetical protein